MMNETAQQNMENHPVIRTLYDHVDEVTCLAFHPTEQILASGSRDYTLKLFDYSKPSAKRAFKYIQVSRVREGTRCIFLKYSELLSALFSLEGGYRQARTEHRSEGTMAGAPVFTEHRTLRLAAHCCPEKP